MAKITRYRPMFRRDFELFRECSIRDGNDSLSYDKIDPDKFDGVIWCCWAKGQIVSIMALENDHYTGTKNVGRVCRYHIDKTYRHGRYGFMMLDHLYEHARSNHYHMIYWTHDIKNKALNALYQHKKRFYDGGDNSFYDRKPFILLSLDTRLLFKDSPTSDMLQYVYTIKFEEFVWMPMKSVIWQEHDGNL
jgi:GNAT superfamily N-acetyltransferase